MPTNITYDERKFTELMLYFALKSEDDRWFGSVKLNKQLFYADFLSFATTGKAITGAKYRKLERGPAPVKLVPVKRQLVDDQMAFEKKVTMPDGLEQKRLLTLRRPDITIFTAEEMELIHRVLESLREYNARDVSDLSHRLAGWQIAAMGEEIPYAAACLPDKPLPLSPAEIDYGLIVAKRLRSAA